MKKITTSAAIGTGAIVEEAWQEVGASFERFCLTAGIAICLSVIALGIFVVTLRGSATDIHLRPSLYAMAAACSFGIGLVGSSKAGHELGVTTGLAALSLDALSSVAYGPEAMILVLIMAGTGALHFTVPLTLVIVGLLALLVISYTQVIEEPADLSTPAV